MKLIITAALFWSSLTVTSAAHEYYLMPETFTPALGANVEVRHRLGQKFKGNEIPWVTNWNIRSEAWQDGEMRKVIGNDGDRPALKITFDKSGLTTVVHQSNVDLLNFSSYEKFQKYVLKEGIEYALEASENGTKPKEGLKEAYSRFAKTLLHVDGGKTGEDKPTGLKIELVLLDNPLTASKTDALTVQLLYEGASLPNATVKVFEGIGQEFSYKTKTDADGKATIKPAGQGPYLLNAIHMTEPQSKTAKDSKAHWESFWASLTFKRAQ